MSIPSSHPRAHSLRIREKLVNGFMMGLVAQEGLIAHGRGETFDYLLGEKTTRHAKKAITEAAQVLLEAKSPVISVNGNVAALCPREIIKLAKTVNAKIEVNLFYFNDKRKRNIEKILKKNGAPYVYGMDVRSAKRISNLDSARRIVDKNGIYSADVVLVPLEDGDRTIALKKMGKKVITFDLNPFSRTSETADITIVDNVVRGIRLLIDVAEKLCPKIQENKRLKKKKFNNKKNIAKSSIEIKNNLRKRAALA